MSFPIWFFIRVCNNDSDNDNDNDNDNTCNKVLQIVWVAHQ